LKIVWDVIKNSGAAENALQDVDIELFDDFVENSDNVRITTIDILKYKIIGDTLKQDRNKAEHIYNNRIKINSGQTSPSLSSPVRGIDNLNRSPSNKQVSKSIKSTEKKT